MQKPTTQTEQPAEGLVISYFGNSVAVEAASGQVFQCLLKRNQTLPLVGDRVYYEKAQEKEAGIIVSILPRHSELARADAKGKMKLIAANIDILAIVMAPPPIFDHYLVNRYLVAAELLNLKAIVVINKVDLVISPEQQAALKNIMATFATTDYSVFTTSAKLNSGMDLLAACFSEKTSVLVGPSGVGKSSLIAALTQEDGIKVAAVSPKGAGKHTTTATRLYHLQGGGKLIDSPGVREFNLWPITSQQVLAGFKEFAPFLGNCKFRDCVHLQEPDCAVQKALALGTISAERYASYTQLMQEADAKPDYKR